MRGGEEVKKKISVVVVMALLFNCASTPRHYFSSEKTRPITISARVGEVIDLEEREKFDLFHGIEDFKAATYYEIRDGGYEVEIITEHSKLRAVNRDINGIQIIRDYIDRYEEIKDSASAFEEKWQIVEYDDLGQPITQDELNRVKGHGWIMGGCLGCLLGFFPALVLGAAVADATEDDTDGLPSSDPDFHISGPGVMTLIMSWATFAMLGALSGDSVDRGKALEVIKRGRQPRVVENF